ncbi:MAG: TetR/AcrR family transcriptional regulator [Syntrophales bacterium]
MSKKDAILNAATVLFSVKGFDQTHMSEISKLTGAAEGTIFYHFKNKEELFIHILKKFKEDIIVEFAQHKKEIRCDSGLDMMESTLTFYLNLASTMEDRFRLLHRHDAYELAKVNPVCKQHLEAIYSCFIDIFEMAILEGQKEGTIINIPPRKAAMIVFSMVDGLVRFNTYNLYDAGSLYSELIELCKRMLENK